MLGRNHAAALTFAVYQMKRPKADSQRGLVNLKWLACNKSFKIYEAKIIRLQEILQLTVVFSTTHIILHTSDQKTFRDRVVETFY